MMTSPAFVPALPGQPYPGARPAPQYPSRPVSGAPATPPWNAPVAQQSPPGRIVRAQADDEPVPARRTVPTRQSFIPLRIPSPEELGVGAAKPLDNTPVDWIALHNRLNALGATCFHLERLAQGGYRITCLLPTNQQGRTRRIEARATNETEAVRLTLARAEEFAAGR